MKRFAVAAALFALLVARPAAAQQTAAQYNLTTYLADVARGSHALAAQRFQIPAAEAQVALARVFPDPSVTGGLLQYDVSQKGNPSASFITLNVPLQIAFQRTRRIAFAEANVLSARADVEDFARTLRGQAASAFVDALHTRLVLERQQRTLQSLQDLVSVNELRFKAGDVGETAVIQSRVEAQQFRALVLSSEGEVIAKNQVLLGFLGSVGPAPSTPIVISGDLKKAAERTFSADALVARAIAQRPDLVAAQRRIEAADRQISLARANRVPDIAIGTGWQHNFSVSTPTPIPESDFISANLTIPLPFSRVWTGELDAAHAQRGAADANQKLVLRTLEVEVRQAVARYDAATARVKLYTGGVLSDAEQVLDKTLYNYRRGGATLVEVLVAQRTVNDVYLSFIDALSDAAHALVDVEQSSAIWDIEL